MSREKLIGILKGIVGPVSETSDAAKRAQFFRKLLLDNKIDEAQFNRLLTEYVDTHKPKDASRHSVLAMRGNLIRELTRPEMTKKVLMRGLDLLKVDHSAAEHLA
jgi:hypothetical protein